MLKEFELNDRALVKSGLPEFDLNEIKQKINNFDLYFKFLFQEIEKLKEENKCLKERLNEQKFQGGMR